MQCSAVVSLLQTVSTAQLSHTTKVHLAAQTPSPLAQRISGDPKAYSHTRRDTLYRQYGKTYAPTTSSNFRPQRLPSARSLTPGQLIASIGGDFRAPLSHKTNGY